MADHSETDLLAKLIGQKHEVLSHLYELSRRQKEPIERDDMTLLYRIFSAKQSLLEKIQALEKQLDPFREQDPESRNWRRPEDRQRTAELAKRCEYFLGELKKIDQQDVETLIQNRDQTAQRLDDAHQATKARTAYTDASGAPNRKLDITSES